MKKNYSEDRGDYARVTSEKLQVIEFDTSKYHDIIQNTEMSTQEKKLDFLTRFVPKVRSLPKKIIEDFEIYFMKEVATQGYFLQTVDDQADYLYFVHRGICKILYPVEKLPNIFGESSFYD